MIFQMLRGDREKVIHGYAVLRGAQGGQAVALHGSKGRATPIKSAPYLIVTPVGGCSEAIGLRKMNLPE